MLNKKLVIKVNGIRTLKDASMIRKCLYKKRLYALLLDRQKQANRTENLPSILCTIYQAERSAKSEVP